MKISRFGLRIGIVLITLLTFARLTTCGFTWWDDHETVHQNPLLNPPSAETLDHYWTTAGEHTTMGLYVPVTYTVWAALAKIAHRATPDDQGIALRPSIFHVANVLLHVATTLLVFELLLQFFGKDSAAAIGAFLFALHPVQVESVGWVSGTKDLLCGLFACAALLCYVRSIRVREARSSAWPARWCFASATLFFVLAMLSKPTAVVVPLMAVAVSVFLLRRPVGKTVRGLSLWFVLMVPFLIVTKLVQPATWQSPLPWWDRPAIAADAVAFYFLKLIWPLHLGIDYGRTPAAVAATGAIYYTWLLPIGVAWLLFSKRRVWPVGVAAGFLFLIPLLPLLGFSAFEFQVHSTTSDHYLYLPMFGVAVLAAWIVSKWTNPFVVGVATMMMLALGTRSVLQEPVWQNTRSLFENAIKVNPRSVASFDGLGFIAGREARLLPKSDPGSAALFEESARWYERSLVYDPTSAESSINLWLDYDALGLSRPISPEPHADPITVALGLARFGDLRGALQWVDDDLLRHPSHFQSAALRDQIRQSIGRRAGGR